MTLPIDLQFRNIGRIHVRSGTTKKQVWEAMRGMLRNLNQIGRQDVLRGIKAGTVTVMEVYEQFRLGKLNQLPTAELMRSLKVAWDAWLEGKEISPKTAHDYEQAFRRLKSHGPIGATLADLPAMMQAHRKAARGRHPRSFNKDRSAALSMLGSVVGHHHWLYGETARAAVLKIPKDKKLRINPLTPEQAHALASKLAPHHSFTFWGMGLTGMRPEEWFEQGCVWTLESDRVKILGTKGDAGVRDVPRVGMVLKPSTGRLAFYRALRKASGETVAPYDLRRSYAIWLELAGIPTYRQDYYMGHGPKDMNALYKRMRECQPHLEEDAKALEQVVTYPTKSPTSSGSNG